MTITLTYSKWKIHVFVLFAEGPFNKRAQRYYNCTSSSELKSRPMHHRSGLKKLQDDSDPERMSSFYSFLIFFPPGVFFYMSSLSITQFTYLYFLGSWKMSGEKIKCKIFKTQIGIWNSLFISSFRHLSGAASSAPGECILFFS